MSQVVFSTKAEISPVWVIREGISQQPVSNWHDIIGDPTIADAILDRLVFNSHRIEIEGETARRKLYDGKCIDIIDHRNDFTKKDEFNNYLDNRIIKVLEINNGDTFTFKEILQLTEEYLKNIEFIYEGNDILHTQERKKNVEKGILKLKN